ncbi:hypothetical protein TDB9533_01238 [Thalassocella blandensis]|nr:hypothetical protein TDB9533_01238 [Thalassocella blandensis]
MKPTNFIDRALLYFAPKTAEQRIRARMRTNYLIARSGYDSAGGGSRGMRTVNTSQNTESRRALRFIRNNVRELERNCIYIGTALDVIQGRTVGMGIKPKAKHPTNKRKQKLAQALMDEWCKSTECDYSGKLNFYGMQSLSIRTIAFAGESLFVKRITTDRRMKVPLRLELLEGDFIDETKDARGLGDQSNILGVKYANGRPSHFFLHPYHPGDYGMYGDSTATPAELIAHGFDVLRPGQARGMPWGYATLMKIRGLEDFQDARIEQQRIAACLVGAIYSDDDEAGVDQDGQPVKPDPLPETMSPGQLLRLAYGEKASFNNPPSVSGQDTFIKGEERLIAKAYGITYESMTGDYSLVNFASGKMGSIEMYQNIDRWRHQILIPQQLKKVEQWWIEAALFVGHDIEGVTFDWTPPKKDILDLKNELPAIISEVRAGMNSLQGALRERGYDVETVLREISEDLKMMDELGLVLDIDPRKVTKSGQFQSASGGTPQQSTGEDENEEDEENA